jgi:hypothetical protein
MQFESVYRAAEEWLRRTGKHKICSMDPHLWRFCASSFVVFIHHAILHKIEAHIFWSLCLNRNGTNFL